MKNHPQENNYLVPPNSSEAEQAVLGGIMLDKNGFEKIADRITEDDFYRHDHRLIFRSIAKLEANNKPFDVITLSDELAKTNELKDAGGLAYLGRLAKDIPSAANICAYADIVRDKSIDRQLISLGGQIAELAQSPDDISTKIDKAQSLMFAIDNQSNMNRNGPILVGCGIPEALNDLQEALENGGAIIGLPTGFRQMDKKTAGMHPGDLIIWAGRPSMGKTTFAMNVAEHVALSGTAVAVFSMEMTRKQIIERLISSLAKIDFQKYRTANLDDHEWTRITSATLRLKNAPLFVDDSPALSVNQVRSRARRLKRKHDIGLVVIDYLQLMHGKGANKNLEIESITQGLKALAKELNVPVIALSQLNRNLESRPNKRPVMSDLRESGAIEQDADLIAFIYRDEVYNEDSNSQGIAELIIRKQRNGSTGTVHLSFRGEHLRFDNYTGPIPSDQPSAKKNNWRGGFDYEAVNK